MGKRDNSKVKEQIKLDMDRFYQMLKNGSITLSQAINNPELHLRLFTDTSTGR